MADGNSTVINFLLGVDTEGESKIERFKEKLEGMGESVSDSTGKAKEQTDGLRDSIEGLGKSSEETESSFMKLTGQGLALLFAGRFLSKTFGSLNRSMMNFVGIGDIVSSTIRGVMAPTFAALVGPISRLSEWFLNLSDRSQMFISVAVMIGTVLGIFLTVFGQLAALAAAFEMTLLGLAKAATPVVTGLMLFVGAAVSAYKAVERFGNIVGVVILVIGALIATFAASPLLIAAATGAIVGAVWAMRDDIADAIISAGEWIMNLPSKIRDAASGVSSAARDLGSRMIDGIEWAIDQGKSVIINALDRLLPGVPVPAMLEAGSSGLDAMSSGIGSRVNDFVITDSGRMLKTHPNDTIIGTKNPESLGSDGGGDSTVINIDNPTVRDRQDIDRMVREVKKELNREMRGRGSTR